MPKSVEDGPCERQRLLRASYDVFQWGERLPKILFEINVLNVETIENIIDQLEF